MQNKQFIEKLKTIVSPLGDRSGMVINTEFKYLATHKELMIVGFNPAIVKKENMTIIDEDLDRHISDENYNSLNDNWKGGHRKHGIQQLYFYLLEHSYLTEKDILYTNVIWERSPSVIDLKFTSELDEICKKGFLLNLQAHKPKAICFIGDDAQKYVSENWASKSSHCGKDIPYPWSDTEGTKKYTIRNYLMEFAETSINAFTIPHQSRFGIGRNPQYWKRRLEAILVALNKSLN
jgi:hypothetical protein